MSVDDSQPSRPHIVLLHAREDHELVLTSQNHLFKMPGLPWSAWMDDPVAGAGEAVSVRVQPHLQRAALVLPMLSVDFCCNKDLWDVYKGLPDGQTREVILRYVDLNGIGFDLDRCFQAQNLIQAEQFDAAWAEVSQFIREHLGLPVEVRLGMVQKAKQAINNYIDNSRHQTIVNSGHIEGTNLNQGDDSQQGHGSLVQTPGAEPLPTSTFDAPSPDELQEVASHACNQFLLESLYLEVRPTGVDGLPQGPTAGDALQSALLRLTQLEAKEGEQHPLDKFLVLLWQYHRQIRGALRPLIEQRGIEIPRRRHALSYRLHWMVVVQPVLGLDGGYEITNFYFHADKDGQQWGAAVRHHGAPVPCGVDKVDEVLRGLLRELPCLYIHRVEMVVPVELLNDGYAHTQLEGGGTLGQKCEVVVRCTERVFEQWTPIDDIQWQWEDRWERLHESSSPVHCHQDSLNPNADYTEQPSGTWLDVSVDLTSSEHYEGIERLLCQGEAALLWSRPYPPGDTGSGPDLFQCDVKQWPEQLRRTRQEGGSTQYTLLWDDPDVRPPQNLHQIPKLQTG